MEIFDLNKQYTMAFTKQDYKIRQLKKTTKHLT